jgi:hypothetical protein
MRPCGDELLAGALSVSPRAPLSLPPQVSAHASACRRSPPRTEKKSAFLFPPVCSEKERQQRRVSDQTLISWPFQLISRAGINQRISAGNRELF